MDEARTSWAASWVRWVPICMVAVAVVFDLSTPPAYTGDPLLAAACVLGGATQTLRGTLWTCAVALAAIVGLTARHDGFSHDSGIGVGNVVIATGIALVVNRAIERYGRRLATVRDVSEAAQRALLPPPPRRLGPLTIAARYDAAQNGARIGGDVYAAQDTPYGIRLLIGDVRGKGLSAVGSVAVLLGAFREAAETEHDLPGLAARLDRALEREAEQRYGEERLEGFSTGLLAEFSTDGGTLRLLNRGHPPPYLLAGGAVRTLEPSAPDLPFGMHGLSAARTEPDEHVLPHGGTLLLVTDGVTESRNEAGEFYDPRLRLPELGPFDEPTRVIETLRCDVDEWTAGRRLGHDDRAVLAVTRD